MHIINLQLTSQDIAEFCSCCASVNSGIEVGQGSKTICGSSLLGLAMIDYTKPVKLISKQTLTEAEVRLFEKWICK